MLDTQPWFSWHIPQHLYSRAFQPLSSGASLKKQPAGWIWCLEAMLELGMAHALYLFEIPHLHYFRILPRSAALVPDLLVQSERFPPSISLRLIVAVVKTHGWVPCYAHLEVNLSKNDGFWSRSWSAIRLNHWDHHFVPSLEDMKSVCFERYPFSPALCRMLSSFHGEPHRW